MAAVSFFSIAKRRKKRYSVQPDQAPNQKITNKNLGVDLLCYSPTLNYLCNPKLQSRKLDEINI